MTNISATLIRETRARPPGGSATPEGWSEAMLTDWFERRLRRSEAIRGAWTPVHTGPEGADDLDSDIYAGVEDVSPPAPVHPAWSSRFNGTTAVRPPADLPKPPVLVDVTQDIGTGLYVAWAYWGGIIRRIGAAPDESGAQCIADRLKGVVIDQNWPGSTKTIAGLRDRHGVHHDEGQFRGYAIVDGHALRTEAYDTYTLAFRELQVMKRRILSEYAPENYAPSTKEILESRPAKGVRKLSGGKYEARVKWDRKTVYLGLYTTEAEARKSHDDVVLELTKRGWPSSTSEGDGVHKVGDKHYVCYRLLRTELLETFPMPTVESAKSAMVAILKKRDGSKEKRKLPPGVYASGDNFAAKVVVEGERKYLGSFTTIDAAQSAIANAKQ